MALVGPRVLGYLGESKVKAAKIQIESFSSALDLFYLDNGRYPARERRLDALVQRPASASAWNGPYLKTGAVPADPWGHPYLYKVPGDHAPYEIASYGPAADAAGDARRPDQERGAVAWRCDDEAGFTLIEIVCVLAIVALLAALVLPAIPRGDVARAARRLRAGDRGAPQGRPQRRDRTRSPVATTLERRATDRALGRHRRDRATCLPDVAFDAMLAQRCGDRRTGSTIDFFPSGMSCGGTIAIARQGVGFQIRVNWLTGGVEVVSVGKS